MGTLTNGPFSIGGGGVNITSMWFLLGFFIFFFQTNLSNIDKKKWKKDKCNNNFVFLFHKVEENYYAKLVVVRKMIWKVFNQFRQKCEHVCFVVYVITYAAAAAVCL